MQNKRSEILHNIKIMRSLRNVVEQIWENGEPSHFPHNPCYTRVNGAKWSESAASPRIYEINPQRMTQEQTL